MDVKDLKPSYAVRLMCRYFPTDVLEEIAANMTKKVIALTKRDRITDRQFCNAMMYIVNGATILGHISVSISKSYEELQRNFDSAVHNFGVAVEQKFARQFCD